MMKASMKMAMADFCSLRMVNEYKSRFYDPARRRYDALVADSGAQSLAIAEQMRRLEKLWKHVRIEPPARERRGPYRVGESFSLSSRVFLGELRPDEVEVQLYYGPMKSIDQIAEGQTETMSVNEESGGGDYRYVCTIRCRNAGRYGFTARITPKGDDRIRFTPFLISWA
jgi:starch phosphorylase